MAFPVTAICWSSRLLVTPAMIDGVRITLAKMSDMTAIIRTRVQRLPLTMDLEARNRAVLKLLIAVFMAVNRPLAARIATTAKVPGRLVPDVGPRRGLITLRGSSSQNSDLHINSFEFRSPNTCHLSETLGA